MKQVDYMVICEADLADLVIDVKRFMACGWQCQGGVAKGRYEILMQAMVRVEEQPK